jgi:hypothetical protein
MDRTYSTHVRVEKFLQNVENRRAHLEVVGIDGRKILNGLYLGQTAWIGFIWLRMRTSVTLL